MTLCAIGQAPFFDNSRFESSPCLLFHRLKAFDADVAVADELLGEIAAAVHTRSILDALVAYLRTPGAPHKARIVRLLTALLLSPAAFLPPAAGAATSRCVSRHGPLPAAR